MGNNEVVDLDDQRRLCGGAFDAVHMGAGTENYVGQVGNITREEQDEAAAKSHERAGPPPKRTVGSPDEIHAGCRSSSARATR